MEFAESDLQFLKTRMARGDASDVQMDEVKLGICLAVSQDLLLEHTYRAFINYRTHEGCAAELKYPSLVEQLRSTRFNSNSWAQSIVFWSTLAIAPAHALKGVSGVTNA